jgi:hypothetical protein
VAQHRIGIRQLHGFVDLLRLRVSGCAADKQRDGCDVLFFNGVSFTLLSSRSRAAWPRETWAPS